MSTAGTQARKIRELSKLYEEEWEILKLMSSRYISQQTLERNHELSIEIEKAERWFFEKRGGISLVRQLRNTWRDMI